MTPWILGFASDHIAAPNAWVSGIVIGAVATAALTKLAEWEVWINFLLGVWVLVSPWVLSFSAQTTARWAHAGIGLIVAVAGRGCGSFIGHGSGSAPNVKDVAMRMRAIRRGPASRSFLRCNAVGPRAGTPLAIRRDY